MDSRTSSIPQGPSEKVVEAIGSIVERGEWSEENLRRLKELVEDASPLVRDAAAWAIGRCPRQEVEGWLLEMVGSVHPEVRQRAVGALVEREHPRACEILAALLDDEDEGVLLTVAAGIGDAGCASLARRAVSRLGSYSQDVAYEFAYAAGRLGIPEAVPHLVPHLGHPHRTWEVSEILMELGDASLLPTLRRLSRRWFLPSNVKIPIAALMARLGDGSLKNYLVAKTRSWFIETRIMAIYFLGFVEAPWAVSRLGQLARSRDRLTAEAAADALSRARGERTEPRSEK